MGNFATFRKDPSHAIAAWEKLEIFGLGIKHTGIFLRIEQSVSPSSEDAAAWTFQLNKHPAVSTNPGDYPNIIFSRKPADLEKGFADVLESMGRHLMFERFRRGKKPVIAEPLLAEEYQRQRESLKNSLALFPESIGVPLENILMSVNHLPGRPLVFRGDEWDISVGSVCLNINWEKTSIRHNLNQAIAPEDALEFGIQEWMHDHPELGVGLKIALEKSKVHQREWEPLSLPAGFESLSERADAEFVKKKKKGVRQSIRKRHLSGWCWL